MEQRFRKVGQTGVSYVVATFVDTDTWETKSLCVRDYDYSDCSRDKDDLYYMPIDEKAAELWRKHCGVIAKGDTVKVVKGRKVAHGTIGTVVNVYDWKDRYGRVQATYAVLEDGQKTNVNNCIIVA